MANAQRLLVNVLIERGVIQALRKDPDDLIASFHGWTEKYGVPVQFIIKWHKEDPVPPKHTDIFVHQSTHNPLWFLYPGEIYNEFIGEAGFAIKIGIKRYDVFRKEHSTRVMIGPCSECCLHWALDRWFINKHTKISSRLGALPQYERVSLRIEERYIHDPCLQDVIVNSQTLWNITKRLEECIISQVGRLQKKEAKRGDIVEMKNYSKEILTRDEKAEQRHVSEKVAEIAAIMHLNEKVQDMTCTLEQKSRRIDFLQGQTQGMQEKILQLERENKRIRHDLELKKTECHELSKKNKAALDSLNAWNSQWNDMENRLRKDNKETTEQLLEGQKEILSSIENVGVDLIGYLKTHNEAAGTQTCSHPERRYKSPLEENEDFKNICSLISKALGDSWRKLGRALGVTRCDLEDIESRYGQFGTEELVWGVLDKWAESGNPKMEDLLQAVKEIGQEAILGPPMTDHHRDILQILHPYLHNEMMDVELLFPYLRGDRIFTSPQIEMIIQGRGRFGKIDNLLKMLPDLGCRAFDGFVKALEQSGQAHIAKKLRETESMDPSVLGSDQMMADTLNRELSEETAVKGIAEGDDDSDVQVFNTARVVNNKCVRQTIGKDESTLDAICIYLLFLIMMFSLF